MPFHLGVDELCFTHFHVLIIFTDTNTVVVHCNPLGLIVILSDLKSFFVPGNAQRVIKT